MHNSFRDYKKHRTKLLRNFETTLYDRRRKKWIGRSQTKTFNKTIIFFLLFAIKKENFMVCDYFSFHLLLKLSPEPGKFAKENSDTFYVKFYGIHCF